MVKPYHHPSQRVLQFLFFSSWSVNLVRELPFCTFCRSSQQRAHESAKLDFQPTGCLFGELLGTALAPRGAHSFTFEVTISNNERISDRRQNARFSVVSCCPILSSVNCIVNYKTSNTMDHHKRQNNNEALLNKMDKNKQSMLNKFLSSKYFTERTSLAIFLVNSSESWSSLFTVMMNLSAQRRIT
jgi:hypothetical protein